MCTNAGSFVDQANGKRLLALCRQLLQMNRRRQPRWTAPHNQDIKLHCLTVLLGVER